VEFNKAALSLAESFTIPSQKSQALNRLLKVCNALDVKYRLFMRVQTSQAVNKEAWVSRIAAQIVCFSWSIFPAHLGFIRP